MKPLQKIIFSIATLISSVTFAGVTDWVEFNLSSGHIKIPSVIEGIDGFTIIDSGASINGINKAFINLNNLTFEEGLPIYVRGVHGKEKVKLINNVKVKIFGADIKLSQLIRTNIGRKETQLLLGAPFLEKFIVQLDYPNSRLRFITRNSIDLRKSKNLITKRDESTGLPIVKVEIDGVLSWLLLDTGSSGGLYLERNIAKKNGWLEKYSTNEDILIKGITRTKVANQLQLPIFTFGPFKLEDVPAYVPEDGAKLQITRRVVNTGTRISQSKKVQGILGYDILKHFVITLDYKNGLVHVAPPEN